MVTQSASDDKWSGEPLTTKEGWRRFVDRVPAPVELLDPGKLGRLSAEQREAYDETRRVYHADLPLANTPTIQKVINTARLLVALNRNQVSARRGLIVSGASGTGKTTALTQLGRTHERRTRKRHPTDRYRLPVLFVTVPPAATARMLAVEFARFLGISFTGRANMTDIVDAVCATAIRTRVELVCVGELHNLNLATRAGADVSDQLKYFAERLPATFTYAGIDVEAAGLFAGVRGRQIAGRFTVVPATAFAYGTSEERAQWRALIATLESTLRLHQHRHGSLVDLDEYLYGRSGGMIGSLSQLLRGAAILAIEDRCERITRDLLELVPVDFAAQRATPTRPARRARRAVSRIVLAPLPIPVGPAHHEILASYVSRLAALHTMPVGELWDQLSTPRPGSRRRVVLADRLATVTDRPARASGVGAARTTRPRPGLDRVSPPTPARVPALRRSPRRRTGHAAVAPSPLRVPAPPVLDRTTRCRPARHIAR